MSKTLTDLNRNQLLFHQPVINPALPEYFQDQYPVFVSLLDKYYDWLIEYTDEGNRKPINELQDISYLKDREISPDRFLQYIFDELASGLAPDNFDIPRFIIKLMPFFYKTKGSTVSAQGFLKFLYGTDIELVYPKNQTFTIGTSEIGAESLKFIQDSYFYQIYSTLIRSDLPISVWKELYKKFVHPAGWELFAEVRFESVTSNTALPVSMPIAALGAAAEIFTIAGVANNLTIDGVFSPANVTVIDASIDAGVRMYGDDEFNYYQTNPNIVDSAYNKYEFSWEVIATDSRRFSSTHDAAGAGFDLSNDSAGQFELSLDAPTIFTLDRLPELRTFSFDNTYETFDEGAFKFYPATGVDSA